MRIAAFGFRTLPPAKGSAGADTFATELYSRLVANGHEVTAYCRRYARLDHLFLREYRGIKLVHLRTVSQSGFDTLLHSFLCTLHIVLFNTGDVVHVHNGGNSVWALPLRLFGKRVFISQDGLDWRRDKWSWYAKLYLLLSSYLTALVPNRVVFDNVYVKDFFEKKFRRRFDLIPYGSDFAVPTTSEAVGRLGLEPDEYFLFVGRFIPDKGLHYLLPAFERVKTDKKLVLVGGSPNPGSEYEQRIRSTKDARVLFPGYLYGDEMLQLMARTFCYVQPSDIEGLSPVLLTAMGMGKPIICSDIRENVFAVEDTARLFARADTASLGREIEFALDHPAEMAALGERAKERAQQHFSWDHVTAEHIRLFQEELTRKGPSYQHLGR